MIWVQIGRTILTSLSSMGMALLTEAFLKDVILAGLEKVAKRTENDTDDKLVESVRKAWGK